MNGIFQAVFHHHMSRVLMLLVVIALSGQAASAANIGFLVGDAFFSGSLETTTMQQLETQSKASVETAEITIHFTRNVIRCSLPKGTIDMGGFIGAGPIRVYGLTKRDCDLLLQLPSKCFGDDDEVRGYRALVYNADFDFNKYHFFCLYNEKWRPDVISEGEREIAVQKLFRRTIRYEPFIGDYHVASEDISRAEYVDGLRIDPPTEEDLIAIQTHSGGPWKVEVSIPMSRSQIMFCARGDELKIWNQDESVRFYIFSSGALQKVRFVDGKVRVVSEVTVGKQ